VNDEGLVGGLSAPHIELGRAGEDLAAEWYRHRGFRILDRNWRSSLGELDLVARSGRIVVMAEVKTRRSDAFGIPALAVNPAKQRRLRRLAAQWLAERGTRERLDVRFDVVAITGSRVDVYERAF
jgi:putative endonuclease